MTDSRDGGATPDNLENALGLAFRRGHGGDDAPRRLASVLLALEERAGPVPRLHLHLPAAEHEPVLKVDHDHELSSRYQIVGEIGQGGVGTVYKGRDADLGRDVAVKVLNERYRNHHEVLQRFVEEAQIGGQLQHPGIVPVYELGLQADDRPFIAMKLVKGQTLATQLERREDPAADRRRFLGIFEQVCQTVAYAHARGVVHRDLKPSNVMIGNFGEVQVVDWGFAKVLRRSSAAEDARASRGRAPASVIDTVRSQEGSSHSAAGSIMGTIPYMPPEQARGQVEDMDERSDVFSLGATLCEILTGTPPYTQVDGDLLAQAAQARLEPAKARLATCGADPELIRIAKNCLSPNRLMRPRDAGVVAEKVAAFLQSVEERARASEVEAAEARAHAEDARKARRLTLALAVSLLLTAFLAGGGYLWVDGVRDAEQRKAENRVHVALDAARRLQGQAEGAGITAVSEWEDAWKSAAAALSLARAESVADGLEQEAAALEEVLRREHERAVQAARQTAREQRLLRTLAEIRLPTDEDTLMEGWVVPKDTNRLDVEYEDAFTQYGIDLDTLAPDEAAKAFGSGIAPEVAAALDHWAIVRRRARGKDDASWSQLLETAGHVDSDPWRGRLRRHLLRAPIDPQELRELTASADFASLPASSLWLLGEALHRIGNDAAALSVFMAGEQTHRLDFALNLSLGLALERADPPQWSEAAARYKVAHALRPKLGRVQFRLGYVLNRAGDLDGSVAAYRESIRLNKGLAVTHNNLGIVLEKKKEREKAIQHYRDAIQAQPGLAIAHTNLAKALKKKGELQEAIEHYREVVKLKPGSVRAHTNLGSALKETGELQEAIELHRKALRLEPVADDSHAHAHAHTGLGAALEKKGELEDALKHHREAIRLEPECSSARRGLGAFLAKRGKLAEAIQHFRKAIQLDPDNALGHSGLGQVLARTGELDEALELCRKAIRLAPNDPHTHGGLAIVLARQGELAEAIEHFRISVDLAPKNATARANLGQALLIQGESDEAMRHLREAVRLNPHDAMAHYNLGRGLYAQRKVAQAIRHYREAIRLQPDAGAHNDLALALSRTGKLEEAVRHYRESVRLQPGDAFRHNNLGGTLLRQGKPAEAIRHFQEGLRLKPGDALVHNDLGLAFEQTGAIEEAIRQYRESIRLRPIPAAHVNLGNALRKRGELERAIQHHREAIRLQPDHADAHHMLAETLVDQGETEKAIGHLRRSIELGPTNLHHAHMQLGLCLVEMGDLSGAMVQIDAAVALKGHDDLSHFGIGAVRTKQGRFADALREFEKSEVLALRDQADPRAVENIRRRIQAIRRWEEVVVRGQRAASPAEWAGLVSLGIRGRRHREVVKLTEETLRNAPELVDDDFGGRYNSACAAALLAADATNDLTAAERSRVRGLARAWLAGDFARWREHVSGDDKKAAMARRLLPLSLNDADFASVRGAAIEKLPADERLAWQKLWAEIERSAKQDRR